MADTMYGCLISRCPQKVCGDVRGCYYLKDPQLERIRHLLGCQFLHTNRSVLPDLAFDNDKDWYNVAIHVSVVFDHSIS